jgi:two-component system nitrate/nitrite response regulator NarL
MAVVVSVTPTLRSHASATIHSPPASVGVRTLPWIQIFFARCRTSSCSLAIITPLASFLLAFPAFGRAGAKEERMAGGQSNIAVLIVADVRLYREGLSSSLAAQDGLAVVGAASERDAALELTKTKRPDVVVLDMATRDSLGLARAIVDACPATRIVAFAVEEVDREILVCAEAGVAAWVPCEGSVDDLVATIKGIVRDELTCSPRLTATLFRRLASLARGATGTVSGGALTGREREIVALIDRGLSNKEIAQRLHLEVATVKNHVHNILEKLQVSRRSEAAARLRPPAPTRPPRSMLAGE